MIYGMKYIRGDAESFEKDTYDYGAVSGYEERIKGILEKRQLNACSDWKKFGEDLSGQAIEDFDLEKYQITYELAPKDKKAETFIGEFITGAIAHKSMVTNRIYESGNLLAGFSKVVVTGDRGA